MEKRGRIPRGRNFIVLYSCVAVIVKRGPRTAHAHCVGSNSRLSGLPRLQIGGGGDSMLNEQLDIDDYSQQLCSH